MMRVVLEKKGMTCYYDTVSNFDRKDDLVWENFVLFPRRSKEF